MSVDHVPELFQPFPKIERYENASCVITEKIDGTNACITFAPYSEPGVIPAHYVQSRNRLITPGAKTDNAGFAAWVENNLDALFTFLGPGRHYGEWWGKGIQHSYGLTEGRWFSPFNTGMFDFNRWQAGDFPEGVCPTPVLGWCQMSHLNDVLDGCMATLRHDGSHLVYAEGYPEPEGCMIWSRAFGYLKAPFNQSHKWELNKEGSK